MMKLTGHNRRRAFTLIELLVVIAIMILVAGLVVGLAGVAGTRKKITRAQAERDRLVSLIEVYKSKVGIYPPDFPNTPGRNTLLYELAGAFRNANSPYSQADPRYETPFGDIRGNTLSSVFGINGLVNASDETIEIRRVMKTVRKDQVAQVFGSTLSLVVPVDGPNGQLNPWNYLKGTNAVHNKQSFDLWVEIVVGKKTNVIGNWKD